MGRLGRLDHGKPVTRTDTSNVRDAPKQTAEQSEDGRPVLLTGCGRCVSDVLRHRGRRLWGKDLLWHRGKNPRLLQNSAVVTYWRFIDGVGLEVMSERVADSCNGLKVVALLSIDQAQAVGQL